MTKLNCLNPTYAFLEHFYIRGQRKDKIRLFTAEDYIQNRTPTQLIPCRKCKACLLNERNRWIGRIMNESTRTKPAYFITLTYKDNPKELKYRDIQLFFKKFRKAHIEKIKYFVVGEYGERFGRPHWHMLLFGAHLCDLQFYKLSANGAFYLSPELQHIWGNGYILVSEFSEATAKYVAGYNLKKKDNPNFIFRVSKNFGQPADERKAMITFTRENGYGLTAYEKQKLRTKFGEEYYKQADKIRANCATKKENNYENAKRQQEIARLFNKIKQKTT